MRCIARTMITSAFLTTALTVFLNILLLDPAHALTVIDSDFSSGTLDGWQTSGNISIQNMNTLPAALKDKWDLSQWNNVMDGNFALMQTNPQARPSTSVLSTLVQLPVPSAPLAVSFDYAVAWELTNPSNDWMDTSYFRGQVHAPPFHYFLGEREILWTTISGTKDVFTGHGSLTIPDRPDYISDEFLVEFLYFNINQAFDAIVGIDNIRFEVSPTETGPAPVPEPASILLLASALAGIGAYARRKRSIKPA